MPSPVGEVQVLLPTLTAVKVILYQGMRDQNIGKTELARRLGWHLPQVDRVLNVQSPLAAWMPPWVLSVDALKSRQWLRKRGSPIPLRRCPSRSRLRAASSASSCGNLTTLDRHRGRAIAACAMPRRWRQSETRGFLLGIPTRRPMGG